LSVVWGRLPIRRDFLMPSPIEDAAHITFRMKQTPTSEDYQFGFSTGIRGDLAAQDLLDELDDWFGADGASLMAQATLTEIVYSEWGTAGFTGFHQKFTKLTSQSSGSGNILPPQCAVVVSLLNDVENGESIKRRRGRIYFGTTPVSHLGTDGRLTSGGPALYLGAMASLQTALNAFAASTPSDSGVCIASRAADLLFVTTKFGVGRGVDTQRRRREKVQELITYEDAVLP
jgi:hypothetical protein